MKKRGRGSKRPKNSNSDLRGAVDSYDPSDSDDGLDDEGRFLLDNARGRKTDVEEEEVYRVYQSSDDDDEVEEEEEDKDDDDDEKGGIGSDMDSDIEGKNEDEGLPNTKAWGSKKQDYYSTDYVDQDYLGFDDEEAALMEEREANEIQKRLLAELEGTDFSLGLLESVEEKKKEMERRATMEPEEEKEIVTKDLSKLSKDELLDILRRESPGFLELMDISKKYCAKMKKYILPMSALCEKLKIPECPATRLLKTYKDCCSIFMMNVSFFLHLKMSQVPNVDRHPVVKIVGQYLTLLRMLDNVMVEKGMTSQMKKLVKQDGKGAILVTTTTDADDDVEITGGNRKERRKKKLMILQKKEKLEKAIEDKEKKIRWKDEVELNSLNKEMDKQLAEKLQEQETLEEEQEKDEDEEENEEVDEKRPITYQMMKNKGLTPKRKKEVRNPRVRNKNKFKKAVKNRRGQVREVRKELSKYGGELSGINKFVSKSIKLK